jgi:hypothetical protein
VLQRWDPVRNILAPGIVIVTLLDRLQAESAERCWSAGVSGR